MKPRRLWWVGWMILLVACNLPNPSPTLLVETTPGVTKTSVVAVQTPVFEAQPTREAPETQNLPTLTSAETPLPIPAARNTPSITVNNLPDGSAYRWTEIVGGLDKPVGLVSPMDGSERLFILEQEGVIRVVQRGVLLRQPFLDIRDRVGSRAPEQGLLGLAFHPRFEENGHFYVNYTDANGDTVIARFTVSRGDPNLADVSSEKVLLFVPQPYPNHNGGAVVFGPDGYLYLGLGDGGSGGDPQGNGQSTQTLLGKILRIDVDRGDPYAIPSDNPFAQGGGLAEIWAYGLRNPWRITFDRVTGDLYIGDVGQNKWEEIDFLPFGSAGGVNFGWDYREGKHRFEGIAPPGIDLVDPVAEYDHSQGCSVTGGVVYRGQALPEWQGVYLYGDYCSGNIWGLLRNSDGTWQNARLFETGLRISSFGEDQAGEAYVLDHASGTVYRLEQ